MAELIDSSVSRIRRGLIFFVVTVSLAVSGYMLAGWTFLDAIYMVVITIFGVGYGEVQPLSNAHLKIFTILVIIAGAISVAYILSGVVQAAAAGELQKALSLRRMTQTIANLKSHVIICGYGRIGQLLAKQLTAEHVPFVILDNNPIKVSEGQALGYLMYLGNATDEETLQAVGIQHARALATVLPDDATNVFITLTAREINATLIILARGEVTSTEKKLRLAGADHVVLPTTISAMRMAYLLIHPTAVDFLAEANGRSALHELLSEIDIQIRELRVESHSPLVGATIGDIEIKGKGTFIIVALLKKTGETLIHPARETVLCSQDTILIMGHQEDMPRFLRRSIDNREMRYRENRLRS